MSPQGQNPDDAARNRDEDLKPGSPPRPATEPEGAEGSARNAKTLTDPATGQPLPGAPTPNSEAGAPAHSSPRYSTSTSDSLMPHAPTSPAA